MSSSQSLFSRLQRKHGRAALFIAVAVVPVALRQREIEPWSFWLVMEDGIYESVGALSCLFAGWLFLATAWRRSRSTAPAASRFSWISSAGLGIACLMMFGEEISWGQRIFGFETPAAVKHLNYQDELSIHNLSFFQPVASFNALLLGGTLVLGLLIVGIPRLQSRSRLMAQLVRAGGIPLASSQVGWLFLMAPIAGGVVAWILWDTTPIAAQFGCETFELLLELCLLFFAIDAFRDAGGHLDWRMLPRGLAVGLPVAILLVFQFFRMSHQTEAFILREMQVEANLQDVSPEQLENLSRKLRHAVLDDPSNGEAHLQLAYVLMAQQRYQLATRHFEIILRLNPNHSQARRGLEEARRRLAEHHAAPQLQGGGP